MAAKRRKKRNAARAKEQRRKKEEEDESGKPPREVLREWVKKAQITVGEECEAVADELEDDASPVSRGRLGPHLLPAADISSCPPRRSA